MLKQFGLEDLEFVNEIGSGYSANVTLYRIKLTGTLCAIKTFTTTKVSNQQAKEDFSREMNILEMVQTHSVLLYGYGSSESPVTIETSTRARRMPKAKINFLVLQYLPNGSLYDYLDEFSTMTETTTKYYFRRIVESNHVFTLVVVQYFHDMNVVHRDLTLKNIMFDEDFEIKIIDFAFSCHYQKNQIRFSKLSQYNGTPPFIAPELVEGAPYLPYPTEVFSLGVILYMMFYGKDPFVVASIEEQSYNDFLGQQSSNQLDDLIKQMTAYNPKDRINLEEIFEHDWMKHQEDKSQALDELKSNFQRRK